MTLAINAHNSALTTTASATSVSVTLSPSVANTVLVAVFMSNHGANSATYSTISSVTGGGLTWTRRAIKQFPMSTGTGGTFYPFNFEEWWAVAPTSGSITVQANFGAFANTGTQQATLAVIAVSGVLNLSNPWDANASLPSTNNAAQPITFTTGPVTNGTTTTSSSSSLLISCAMISDVINLSDGTGMTAIQALNTNAFVEAKIVSSSGTQSVPWGGTGDVWAVMADAISGDASASSGTIATNLAKISQSVTGAMYPKGTIATALSKAALSASGAMYPKGTISTALTKASQALAGKQTLTGTINTSLSKPTISASAVTTLVRTGTISSSLNMITQSASGWMEPSGAIATRLTNISIAGNGKEIFLGAVATNLDDGTGKLLGVVSSGSEVFVGSITTNLTRANFAASGFEEMVGAIHTKLGSANGHITADVIEALVIIQGPIVTTLSPVRSLILGAKLGTPGDNRWFSWRYTDA